MTEQAFSALASIALENEKLLPQIRQLKLGPINAMAKRYSRGSVFEAGG